MTWTAADLRAALAAACADVQHATDAAIEAHALCVYHSDDPAAMRRARDLYLVAATQAAALRRVRRIRHQLQQMGATP